MSATLEATNVTQLRAGDRVRVEDISDDYLVVSTITVRSAHTEVAYISISDRNRIQEHRVEYGNTVCLPVGRYRA